MPGVRNPCSRLRLRATKLLGQALRTRLRILRQLRSASGLRWLSLQQVCSQVCLVPADMHDKHSSWTSQSRVSDVQKGLQADHL